MGSAAVRTDESPLLAVATPEEVGKLHDYAVAHAANMSIAMTLRDPFRAGALVLYYADLCLTAGIDLVLAVCQSWLESRSWSSWWFDSPRRNPAGIGVTGAVRSSPPILNRGRWQPDEPGIWRAGRAFPSYALAAMQQVYALAQWAGGDPSPVAARLRSESQAPIGPPRKAVGSATQWKHLGFSDNPAGIGWAMADGYGKSIANVANRVLG